VSAAAIAPVQDLNALLARALHAAPLQLAICDMTQPDHPLVFVNPAFEHVTGYPAEAALGRNPRFLQGPESDPDVVRAMRETIAAGQAGAFEILNRRRDGAVFLNRVELTPLLDRRGRTTAYLGIQRDISDFRRSATDRREREKLETLGRVAGGFAHEVNNLLQPILTFSGLLRERLADADADAREEVALIEESARAASAIARGILDLSRRDGDAAAGRPRPLGIELDGAVRLARAMLPARIAVEVVAEPEGAAVPVRFASGAFVQVIGNLLRNAADAMPDGGCIHIALTAEGAGAARLTVRDEGHGMSEAVRARVFEPFFTTKPVGTGTGLGLAEVWSMVRSWGGDIAVASAPREGTTFTLRLPAADDIEKESD
jgi:PAS domain S-box-containing protein